MPQDEIAARSPLDPFASFTTNPAGLAIVNAICRSASWLVRRSSARFRSGGELDLVISACALENERFASRLLIEDRFVAVLRAGHPALRKKLSGETLVELRHLAISSSGENLDFVDASLRAHKAAHARQQFADDA